MRRLPNKYRGGQRGLMAAYEGQYKQIYENEYGVPPSWVKHFWPCDEYRYGVHVEKMIDVVEGYNIIAESNSHPDFAQHTAIPDANDNHVVAPDGQRVVNTTESARFECFNNQDWIVIVVAKSDANGNFECTIGSSVTGLESQPVLKLQPYYVAVDFPNAGGVPWGFLQTPWQPSMQLRTEGQDYVIAWLYRNGALEHWVDGVMIGQSATLTDMQLSYGRTYGYLIKEQVEMLPVMRPHALIRLGHSSSQPISVETVASNPDYDYDHFVFEDSDTLVQRPGSFGSRSGFPSGTDRDTNSYTGYNGILIGSWDVGTMPADIAGLCNNYKTKWQLGDKDAAYTF